MYDTLVVNAESESAPPAKRRRLRLSGKSPADQLYEPLGEVDTLEALRPLLTQCETLAPRVGKRILSHGPTFDAIAQVFPDMSIQAIDVCIVKGLTD